MISAQLAVQLLKEGKKCVFRTALEGKILPGSNPWILIRPGTLKSRISQGKLQIVEGEDSIPGLEDLEEIIFPRMSR